MAARHFNVTLGAAAVKLSTVYGVPEASQPEFPRADIPYRQLLFWATGADAFIGASSVVSATDFGIQVDSTNVSAPASIGPFETGPVKLSDLWAAGAGAVLHILGIPF